MPASLVIRWNATRRPKEAMSGYAPSGVIHPFWVRKPKFFCRLKAMSAFAAKRGHSETEAFMPFLISPGLRLYEFLITNGRTSALRHVTRELCRTRHLVTSDQPPPNLDGSS